MTYLATDGGIFLRKKLQSEKKIAENVKMFRFSVIPTQVLRTLNFATGEAGGLPGKL
jgi:hypothetical protein